MNKTIRLSKEEVTRLLTLIENSKDENLNMAKKKLEDSKKETEKQKKIDSINFSFIEMNVEELEEIENFLIEM